MKITTVGIDLAKNVFQLHGVAARAADVYCDVNFDQSRGFSDVADTLTV